MQETSARGERRGRGAVASPALLGAARRDRPRRYRSRRCAADRAVTVRPVRGVSYHRAPSPGRPGRAGLHRTSPRRGIVRPATRIEPTTRRRPALTWTTFGRRNSRRPSTWWSTTAEVPPSTIGDALGGHREMLHILRVRRERRTREPLMITEAWLPTDLAERADRCGAATYTALRVALWRRCCRRSDAARDHRRDRGSAQRAVCSTWRSGRRCFE